MFERACVVELGASMHDVYELTLASFCKPFKRAGASKREEEHRLVVAVKHPPLWLTALDRAIAQ